LVDLDREQIGAGHKPSEVDRGSVEVRAFVAPGDGGGGECGEEMGPLVMLLRKISTPLR